MSLLVIAASSSPRTSIGSCVSSSESLPFWCFELSSSVSSSSDDIEVLPSSPESSPTVKSASVSLILVNLCFLFALAPSGTLVFSSSTGSIPKTSTIASSRSSSEEGIVFCFELIFAALLLLCSSLSLSLPLKVVHTKGSTNISPPSSDCLLSILCFTLVSSTGPASLLFTSNKGLGLGLWI